MTQAFPPSWTKTLTELLAEMAARHPEPQEVEWARAYELSELRKWARFPTDGDVFEATDEVSVQFLTHWRAPFTDGGSGVLQAGTRVRVSVFPGGEESVAYYAVPLDSGRTERELVPETTRANEKYDGFSLSIHTADLNRSYRLVPSHVA